MLERSEAWHSRMKAFGCHCRASAPWEQAERIREARGLLRAAHDDGFVEIGFTKDRAIEQLLSKAAYECAALEVLGDQSEFELSGGTIRACTAKVRLPGQRDASVAEGRTIALALLAAWAAANLAEMEATPAG